MWHSLSKVCCLYLYFLPHYNHLPPLNSEPCRLIGQQSSIPKDTLYPFLPHLFSPTSFQLNHILRNSTNEAMICFTFDHYNSFQGPLVPYTQQSLNACFEVIQLMCEQHSNFCLRFFNLNPSFYLIYEKCQNLFAKQKLPYLFSTKPNPPRTISVDEHYPFQLTKTFVHEPNCRSKQLNELSLCYQLPFLYSPFSYLTTTTILSMNSF